MAAVGEMAAGVAHELNNPLTTVTGFVELALDELPADLPQRAELELVLAEAHRARKVVRSLLDFSRQSEHQRLLVDPGSLLEDLMPLIKHQTHGAEIQIEVDCQKGLCLILVDPDQIKQVLLNLVQNAIQSMPDGGELKIFTETMVHESQAGAVFTIQDTGKGILPEHIDRLFEPFFTTRSVGFGTGLGLSVSYGIVTDHNGQIFVESQVGEGSIFRVWFPANKPVLLEQK
jgi:two-component system NtrC family sensor kinase